MVPRLKMHDPGLPRCRWGFRILGGMKTLVLTLMLLLSAVGLSHAQSKGDEKAENKFTKVKKGDRAPAFECTTVSGEKFSLGSETGKVVLVFFFSTGCGPCMETVPRLEKDVYQKYGNRQDFNMIAFGRRHKDPELKSFIATNDLSFLVAADPVRGFYHKYASQYIPRNYLIGKNGTIAYESVGYTEDEFEILLRRIAAELDR